MNTRIVLLTFLIVSMSYIAPLKAKQDSSLIGLWHFDEGSGTTAYDSSGYNNYGTIKGATWVTGVIKKALSFDGMDDYVAIPDIPQLGGKTEATFEYWVKYESDPIDNDYYICGYIKTYNGPAIRLGRTKDAVFVNTGTHIDGNVDIYIGYTFLLNVWYHLALTLKVWDKWQVFVNGELIGSGTSGLPATIIETGHEWGIGASIETWESPGSPGPIWHVSGVIDEVRVYNRALTAAEIEQSYIEGTPFRAYTIINLGLLGNDPLGSSVAHCINDLGQVAGWSDQHAFLWSIEGGMKDLGTLGAGNSMAFGINNKGHVVGGSQFIEGSNLAHAFLWTKEEGMLDLGTLPGWDYSRALAINDLDQVVGYCFDDTEQNKRAFLWTREGGMKDLGALLGGTWSEACDINNLGQIVGNVEKQSVMQAFLWTERGGIEYLGSHKVGGWSSAKAINNKGEVVGHSDTVSSGSHAFLWTKKNSMIDLGSFDAWDINDKGQVVGKGHIISPSIDYAVLWIDGKILTLRTLDNNPSNGAYGINNGGQITGWSGETDSPWRAVVWNPSPIIWRTGSGIGHMTV